MSTALSPQNLLSHGEEVLADGVQVLGDVEVHPATQQGGRQCACDWLLPHLPEKLGQVRSGVSNGRKYSSVKLKFKEC